MQIEKNNFKRKILFYFPKNEYTTEIGFLLMNFPKLNSILSI